MTTITMTSDHGVTATWGLLDRTVRPCSADRARGAPRIARS